MKVAMCLEAEVSAKWHHTLQMGVTDAVAIRDVGTSIPIWDYLALARVKSSYEDFGFDLRVIEGWLPMDNIRLGTPEGEAELDRFIAVIRNMGALGIETFCYNWMAKYNWLRTSTTTQTRGGALTTSYDHTVSEQSPASKGEVNPTEDHLWKTLEGFLTKVLPIAEKEGVKLAMHPDDPPLSPVFGVGRIMRSVEAFERLLDMFDSEANGITYCQGNFAAMNADVPGTIRSLGKDGRIHFAHFRDIQGDARHIVETFHDAGKTNMFAAMKAYKDIGFKGVMRPDHAPVMYGERNDKPGYESLGRLFAVGYMKGLIEGVEATSGK